MAAEARRFFRVGRRDLPALALVVAMAAVALALLWRARADAAPRPGGGGAIRAGEELAVVFLVSSSCGATRVDGLPEAVRGMRPALEAEARRRGMRFAAAGVALDWSARDGFRLLRRFGDFDEVAAGRNWLNSGAVRYVWGDVPGEPSIPQVVVVSRRVDLRGGRIVPGPERLLARKVGADEILRWAEQGYPVPRPGAAPRS